MSKIYCVVDKIGFIATFSTIEKAKDFIKKWEDKVKLIILEFSINNEKQKSEIYFLPYKGHEGCHNFPVALVTNDKEYYLNVQNKLVKMGLAFPDDIEFFTKKIDEVAPNEYNRLTSNFEQEDLLITEILTNLKDENDIVLKDDFDTIVCGNIIGPDSVYLLNKSEEIGT